MEKIITEVIVPNFPFPEKGAFGKSGKNLWVYKYDQAFKAILAFSSML